MHAKQNGDSKQIFINKNWVSSSSEDAWEKCGSLSIDIENNDYQRFNRKKIKKII